MLHESPPRALARLVGKNRRRYGRYLIHVDVVAIFVGIAASSAFRIEEQQTLNPGQEMHAGKFTLRFERITTSDAPHVSRMVAEVSVWRDGQQITTLAPEKRFYKKPQQPTTEVAMRSTLTEDLYLVLGSYDPPTGLVTIQAYVNPLVSWLWIGGRIMGLGTVATMWPSVAERRRSRTRCRARGWLRGSRTTSRCSSVLGLSFGRVSAACLLLHNPAWNASLVAALPVSFPVEFVRT